MPAANDSDSRSDAELLRLQKRRLRMRIAQRRHRDRQSKRVENLDDEVSTLQRRVTNFETHFNELEAKILGSTVQNTLLAFQLRSAMSDFRRLSSLQPSPYQDMLLVPDSLPINSGAGWLDLSGIEPLSSFSFQLFSYCATLALQIVSTRDISSLRLAHRIFQYRLALDAVKSGEERTLNYLRDTMSWWCSNLNNQWIGPRFARKSLDNPRWPGYTQMLDAAGVEDHLKKRGAIITPEGDEVLLKVDMVPEDPPIAAHTSTNDFYFDYYKTAGTSMLPFGLQSLEGPLPGEMQSFSDYFSSESTPDESRSAAIGPDTSRHLDAEPSTSFVRVSTSNLVQRLAFQSVCIGAPGPGIMPDELDNLVENLINTTPRSIALAA